MHEDVAIQLFQRREGEVEVLQLGHEVKRPALESCNAVVGDTQHPKVWEGTQDFWSQDCECIVVQVQLPQLSMCSIRPGRRRGGGWGGIGGTSSVLVAIANGNVPLPYAVVGCNQRLKPWVEREELWRQVCK